MWFLGISLLFPANQEDVSQSKVVFGPSSWVLAPGVWERGLAERGYKVLHFHTEDFWGDEADLIQRIRDAWPGARSLLPVQVKPKGYTPTGPGRAVALPSDLQEAVDILRRP